MKEHFWILCKDAQNSWENDDDLRTLEPELIKVLNFIKSRSQDYDYFKLCFVEIISGGHIVPFEVIEFCMRELQWREVYDAALQKLQMTDDFRIRDIMARILEVYEPTWRNLDLYSYYFHKGVKTFTEY